MALNLWQHAVVSYFIHTASSSPEGPKFVLFKRSDVKSSRGKWTIFSGSIETKGGSFEAAVKREVLEETRLSEPYISLLRRGKQYRLTDHDIQTQWTTHPFAWQLQHASKPIKLDWEHTEYKFDKPQDLGHYDYVPQPELGLQRATVSPETEKRLASLKDDHESGPGPLVLKALGILLKAVQADELARLTTPEDF